MANILSTNLTIRDKFQLALIIEKYAKIDNILLNCHNVDNIPIAHAKKALNRAIKALKAQHLPDFKKLRIAERIKAEISVKLVKIEPVYMVIDTNILYAIKKSLASAGDWINLKIITDLTDKPKKLTAK